MSSQGSAGSRAPSSPVQPEPPASPTAEQLCHRLGIIEPGSPSAQLVLDDLAAASRVRHEVTDYCARKKLILGDRQVLGKLADDMLGLVFGLAGQVVRLHRELSAAQAARDAEAGVPEILAEVRGLREDVVRQGAAASAAVPPAAPPGASSVPPPPAPGRAKSFASVAAMRPKPVVGSGVVVVAPSAGKAELDTADKVRAALRSAVRPAESGWQVVGVRSRGSRVELRLGSEEAARQLVASKAISDAGLTATVVGRREPRIVVYDVPRDLSPPEVLAAIRSQNFSGVALPGGDSWATFSHFSGPRESPTRNVILAVHPAVRSMMVDRARVYVDWRSCRVADFVGVTRCWNCHDYGHPAAKCKRPEICGHCGLAGHRKAACPDAEKPPVCPSCRPHGRPSDHSVEARDVCGSYARAFRRAVDMTNYDV